MNEALWRVQLSTGEIRTMTIEALDEAFNQGLIDARVHVLPPGASAWMTLGEAAGLDPEPPPDQAPSLSPVAIPPSSSTSRIANDDLDLPEEIVFAARSRRRAIFAGIAGVGALALALAVIAGKIGGSAPSSSSVNVAFAVEAPLPAAAEALPPPEQPAASPEPAKEQAAKVDEKTELSDWQKRMLLDADKAREDKARTTRRDKVRKAEKAQKTNRPPKKRSTKAGQGLLNGGDRFDPLNGAL